PELQHVRQIEATTRLDKSERQPRPSHAVEHPTFSDDDHERIPPVVTHSTRDADKHRFCATRASGINKMKYSLWIRHVIVQCVIGPRCRRFPTAHRQLYRFEWKTRRQN